MRLLFDQNLSFKLARNLNDVFPGSSQVRLAGLAEAEDDEVWDYARANSFTIVSKDSDYHERSVLFGHPPKVIWLRCGNQATAYIEQLLRAHLPQIRLFEQDQTTGCIEIY